MASKKFAPSSILQLPLSGLRFISSYPKEKKMIFEVNTEALKAINEPQTLDEIINAGRIDYAFGKYKSFKNPKKLIAELKS